MTKSIFLIFLLVISISSLAQTETINAVIDAWHKAAEEADSKTYFEIMVPDAVFVGSDASEVWNYTEFKAFAEPYFEAGKAWTFTPVNRHVYTNKHKTMAWFDEVLNSDHMGLCRGSGVLILDENENWKIQHYVLSLAVPNDLVEELVKQKAIGDKAYLESQP